MKLATLFLAAILATFAWCQDDPSDNDLINARSAGDVQAVQRAARNGSPTAQFLLASMYGRTPWGSDASIEPDTMKNRHLLA